MKLSYVNKSYQDQSYTTDMLQFIVHWKFQTSQS